ncbi:CG14667 [Drosophila busckii]|uniref:CG14667 n=1 Tax=Drosophila busckii TaxID=30019 RepID=A0A0M4F335_DROBS|nr:transcription factor Ouib [Drosophila busckii]ALC45950.1 CG14667 [Drosophila busckii]
MDQDLLDVCRVCANKIKDKKRQRHIFSYMRGKLNQNLKLITGVELTPEEYLPSYICERCNSELEFAMKFRERCIFSQKYLRDMIDREHCEKVAGKAPDELSEDLIDEDQLEYMQDDYQTLNDNEEEEDASFEYSESIDDNSQDAKPYQVENIDYAAQEQSRRAKRHLVLLKESRPKRARNFFICEECGQFFITEDKYTKHLEGHIELKESVDFFPCGKCTATFPSRSLLKTHRREEHSIPQFKCTICDEVFLEYCAKQRHEKAHVNERPYPCLECGDMFQKVTELRAHFEIHAERKLRCEPCDKDFKTRKLLETHLNTKLHKRMQSNYELLYD